MTSETATTTDGDGLARTLGDYVNSDSVVVRFLALWSLCVVLFAITWIVAYEFLPEGLLRRASGPGPLATTVATVWNEFLALFAWNLGFAALVVAANTFRSVRTPMGYLVVLVMWIQGAIIWGTNSLTIQTGRLAPSLSVVLERSGGFELTALVAIAVATRGVLVWHQRTGPRWREEFERVQGPRDWTISRGEVAMLLAGLALLAAANYREATMIVAAAG